MSSPGRAAGAADRADRAQPEGAVGAWRAGFRAQPRCPRRAGAGAAQHPPVVAARGQAGVGGDAGRRPACSRLGRLTCAGNVSVPSTLPDPCSRSAPGRAAVAAWRRRGRAAVRSAPPGRLKAEAQIAGARRAGCWACGSSLRAAPGCGCAGVRISSRPACESPARISSAAGPPAGRGAPGAASTASGDARRCKGSCEREGFRGARAAG